MKKLKLAQLLIIAFFFLFTYTANSQMMEPDDPGGDPVGEDPLGGGAPLKEGTILLISLGMIYGGKKFYQLKKVSSPAK